MLEYLKEREKEREKKKREREREREQGEHGWYLALFFLVLENILTYLLVIFRHCDHITPHT